jgi:hypothetical protein
MSTEKPTMRIIAAERSLQPMSAIDREKKIAEVLDLSKPVSDCPECGGLGEIRSLGSRRKCECLYIRLKTLKRELDRKDEENQKLRCELESAKNYGESVSYWRQIASKINQEAQQEIERLEQERDKLIEGLRIATDVLGTVPMNDARLWGVYNKLCDVLKEIGVTVEWQKSANDMRATR